MNVLLATFHCLSNVKKMYIFAVYPPPQAVSSSDHSEKKGHVPNQSLYKGWEQSFPQLSHDQKMDIISCQDGQFSKCRNEICFLLVRF